MEKVLPRDLAAKQLYPVDINWHPHFTMLVDLVGHGDAQVPPLLPTYLVPYILLSSPG